MCPVTERQSQEQEVEGPHGRYPENKILTHETNGELSFIKLELCNVLIRKPTKKMLSSEDIKVSTDTRNAMKRSIYSYLLI